jgi:hypothetical protein
MPKTTLQVVEPFSITGIEKNGFSPKKNYPVIIVEKHYNLLFGVRDNNGDFTFINADECKIVDFAD